MSGRKKKDPRKRLRFTIPSDDTAIHAWLKVQANPSASFRLLVADAIAAYGMRDLFWAKAGYSESMKTDNPPVVKAIATDVVSSDAIDETVPNISDDEVAREPVSHVEVVSENVELEPASVRQAEVSGDEVEEMLRKMQGIL